MFTLIFDKGTAKEKSLALQSFYERPISNIFTGNFSTTIDKQEDVPDVEDFIGDATFTTVTAISSEGFHIPISGRYNHIVDFACNYNDDSKIFGINITLDWVAPVTEEPANAE